MFKDKQESVALFGGSFDPPHIGHKSVVEEALLLDDIDKIILVPTFLNPFKKVSFSTPQERLKMTAEMFIENTKVEVNDFEVRQNKTTKTATTLQYFQQQYDVRYLIIGADNLSSIDKWYNFEWLNRQITWLIATRNGYPLDTSKLRSFKILEVNVDISSTEIRKTQNKGQTNCMNLDERIDRIVTLLDTKKGEEIEVFDLEKVEYIAKRVVLVNSLGGKHAAALADHLKNELKPQGEEFLHIDESEDWVVIDMGDILIHIMSTTYRQKYSLEEFLTEISNRKEEEI